MTLLIAGVALWSVVHLIPAVAAPLRARLVSGLGEGPFKGMFSLLILVALAMIVQGWRTTAPETVYVPALYGSRIPVLFVAVAVVLLVASSIPNNVKRFVRHPQMTAVILWGAGHLLANGDNRSMVLFGGLTLWAILEILSINRRDGNWTPPPAVPTLKDAVMLIVSAAAFVGLAWFHASLFGVPAIAV